MAGNKTPLVIAAVWYLIATFGPENGPKILSKLNDSASKKYTPWQISVFVLTTSYLLSKIPKVLGVHKATPDKRQYSPEFARTVRALTGIQAGSWTAKNLEPKIVRDFVSLLLSGYYFVREDEANNIFRSVHEAIDLDSVRLAFNISHNVFLNWLGRRLLPSGVLVRKFQIPRQSNSDYKVPIDAILWYSGSLEQLKQQTKVILHIHGGGFVANAAMDHRDSCMAWTLQTGVPIVSVDYKLSPEYIYPYALNEVFEAYLSIILSKGITVGLDGHKTPDVVITGDSAGGNLAASLVLKIITYNQQNTPVKEPVGLVMTYPVLYFSSTAALNQEDSDLFRQFLRENPEYNASNRLGKANFLKLASGKEPVHDSVILHNEAESLSHDHTAIEDSQGLILSAPFCYADDRLLTPTNLALFPSLYIGPQKAHDTSKDIFISPGIASDHLLAKFPKTYINCGEADPLLDSTILFSTRLKNINQDLVEVKLLPGVSHGYIQLLSVYPPAKHIYNLIGNWFLEAFEIAAEKEKFSEPEDLDIVSSSEANLVSSAFIPPVLK